MTTVKLSELAVGCVFTPQSDSQTRYMKIVPIPLECRDRSWRDPDFIFSISLVDFKLVTFLDSPVLPCEKS